MSSQAISIDDEEYFDQLWDTPELKRIDKRFRRDPYVAIPELLRAGRTVWEVAEAFKSCGLITDFGEGYIVPETDVIHAAAKNGADWEISDVFHTREAAAQRVADEIAAEITHKLTPGVDDFVEVETFLFGFDQRGEAVRVKAQTHIIILPDEGEFGRI
ncbi:hypothetical protein [Methylococcus sp. EFPC2]|uniref:hypothetical protein n=1 Tax=Methylococcus sp. EFPC2 TaxID=2812648 RepID=UPI00196820AC|nr:hypothetical protein [Methylococcus sp. EFPC2]QSA97315.1 hypothetical protein JWZ97_00220 [Methylococcus sp. EFPC2]